MDAVTLNVGQLVLAFIAAMGIPSAIMGFVMWKLERRISKRETEMEQREQAQEELFLLIIQSTGAAIALGEATARAVQRIPDAHCNGDMHEALAYATDIKHKQKDFLTKQGIGVEMCEPSTIKYTGGASFTDNNPTKTKETVLRTYQSAVELFAMLCKKYGLDPLADGVIISHKEGCARGIASNHGDPDHLWSRFGLTMDGFRRDVKAAMGGSVSVTPAPSTSNFPSLGLKVGDVVDFIGTTHYVSANASKAATCKPGKAKVTQIYNGKHPYQLIHVAGGGSTVYGWVDEKDIQPPALSAVDKLASLGVINSPDYWKQSVTGGKVKYLDTLLTKAAAKITKAGTRSATPEAGVAALVSAGIIDTPDYWLANYGSYPSLGELLRALGGSV